MGKYLFVTKKGRVIVKTFKSEKQAWLFVTKGSTDMEVWEKPKGVMEWLAQYKPTWLTNALIKADGKIIK